MSPCSIEKSSACFRLTWGGPSHVLFLGLVLLLIGRVRVGLVILEVTDEFGVEPATTLMTFWVSVPVLSMQMTEALAIVSQEPRIRTRSFSAVIHLVAKARARVTAKGRPSGTATTTNVTEMIKMLEAIPFLLGVLRGVGGHKKHDGERTDTHHARSQLPN